MGKKDTIGKDFQEYIRQHAEKFTLFPNYAAEVVNNFCTLDISEEDLEKEEVDMCKAVRDMKAEERAEGRAEGEIRGKVFAYNDVGLSVSEIAEKCKLSEDEVKEILQN